MYDTVIKDIITLGNTGSSTPVKLTNLAEGALTTDSKEAVNGSQLFATNTNVVTNSTGVSNNTTAIAAKVDQTALDTANTKITANATSITENTTAIAANKTHFVSINGGADTDANYNNDGATGKNAVAIGKDSRASGDYSTATGFVSKALGFTSTATGHNSKATRVSGTATGDSSLATGDRATATGYLSKSSGHHSTATGDTSLASGSYSTATGVLSKATGASSFAAGNNSLASLTDSVALGANSVTSVDKGVAGYDSSTGAASTNAAPTWKATAAAVNVGDTRNSDANKWKTRQITGVAAGAADTDAVNVAQLKTVVNDMTLIKNNVASSTTAIGTGASVSSKATNSLAIGKGATVGSTSSTSAAKNSIAIGTGSKVSGKSSISVGTGNVVKGNGSGAIGDPSYINANNAYSVGNNNTIDVNANNTFVLGSEVNTDVADSVALGNKTNITAGSNAGTAVSQSDGTAGNTTTAGDKGVVAGASIAGTYYKLFSGAESHGAVSVGASGNERRIQNVAAGEVSQTSTDAINGSQLYTTNRAISDLGYKLSNQVDGVEQDLSAGIASSASLESAPYVAGKWTYAAGASSFNRESAIGVSMRRTAINGKWSINGGVSTNTQNDALFRIGVSGVID